MKRSVITGLFLFLFLPYLSNAQKENSFTEPKGNNLSGFIENKGQIIDQNNIPNPAVLYLLHTPGMNVQLRKGGFSYDLYLVSSSQSAVPSPLAGEAGSQFPIGDRKSINNPKQDSIFNYPLSIINYHRIDIDLLNANLHPTIVTSAPSSGYLNYYTTGSSADRVTFVRSYATVTYKNIYPGIDLQFIADNDRLFEYNFILQPGADIMSIKLKVHGPEKIKGFREGLLFETSLGDVDETIPMCYYEMNDIRVPVKGRFKKIAGHIYGFSLDQTIPTGAILLIDPIPTRRWGTYYGGTEVDGLITNSCVIDNQGNVIICGYTESTTNIATAGAFQTVLSGNMDAYLAKFSPDGQRLWGTYYGGNIGAAGSGCAVDKDDNIFLIGSTQSVFNIATPGTFQSVLHGNRDAFLVKFDPSGQRIWGTYYGGNEQPPLNGDDGFFACVTDTSGNVYCTGRTTSPDNIASPGAQQTSYGGNWDGYLVKFTKDGQRVWGTYYGGSDVEQSIGGALSKNGFVYISGITNSPDNIATPGSFLPTYSGLQKGFLACFDLDGQRQWGTYFGGESSDGSFGCTADTGSSVYLFGQTHSMTNIATPGAFQSTFIVGGENGYVEKFSVSGQRLWGTYMGICGVVGGAVDDSGFVYFTGQASSIPPNQNLLIATPGAFKTAAWGVSDAYLEKFTGNGQQVWGTFYGGTIQDKGYSCAVDASDNIYLAGGTHSTNNGNNNTNLCSRSPLTNYIATPGSNQEYFGGITDAFLVKFADCYSPDTALQVFGPAFLCQNSTGVIFSIAPLVTATDYHWCVTGNLTITSGQGSPSITIDVGPTLGLDSISIYGINPCDAGFPKVITRMVLARPVPVITGPDTSCTLIADQYSTAGLKNSYQWTVSSGGTITFGGTPVDSTCTVTWNSPGAQWVRVSYTDTNGCQSLNPTQFNVWVTATVVDVNISVSANPVCEGILVTYTANPINGGNSPVYQWKVNGIIVGISSPTFSYIPLNGDNVTCILTSSITVCVSNNPATSNGINMVVNPNLLASVSVLVSANPVCAGTIVTFTANPVNGGTAPVYQWYKGSTPVGSNSNTYSYIPANGDVIKVVMTSSPTPCLTGSPATSNAITMTVNPLLSAGVTISADANPVCAGTSVTFTATPINGGTTPVYQWYKGSTPVGTNSTIYSYIPANGDVITVVMTSSASPCLTGSPATSNAITMTVNPILTVSVTISADANPVCAGTSVTFTATPVNGGTTPVYHWYKGSAPVGSNNDTYSYIPVNGDIITVVMTANPAPCLTGSPATSNAVTMTVGLILPANVTITASANPVCAGTSVAFTAIPVNGGTTPVYLWKVNGINAWTNSPNFSYIPQTGDSIRCIMTSNLACVSNNPASSNKIVMIASSVPLVTFTICFDSITRINAKPIKLKGGIPLGGNYTGPGVNSITGVFTPSVAGIGTKIITYSYTNIALCSASKTKTIIVQSAPAFTCGNNLTDIRDNKVYPTIQFGSQCWMGANLDYGFQIPETSHQRDNCVPEKYKSAVSSQQSAVYQWDEIMRYDDTPGLQGLCPPAWHVPTEAEWNTLFANWTNNAFAGAPLKYSGYSGFNALLSGVRHLNVQWDYQNLATFFWSSTPYGAYKAWSHGMNDYDPSVAAYPSSRVNAFTVRCLKD